MQAAVDQEFLTQDQRLILAEKRDKFSSMNVVYKWFHYPGRPTYHFEPPTDG